MKCEICGGELLFQDGIYICESCGSKSESSVNIEAFDVYLMYNEFDEQGRRCKSSIIAQEIYNKLKQNNISVFYEKNYDNVFGDERIKLKDYALYKTSVVIMIGTKVSDFKELSGDKYIIPVYADVEVYKLPSEIQKLQALNYNDIGAIEDLSKAVMNVLGREYASVNFIDEAERKKKLKKKRITIASIVIAAVIVLSSLSFVLFSPHVLPANQYKYAQKMVENKQYLEAIDWFNKNPEYKSTQELLKKLYDEYDGVYISSDKKTMLELNILNGTSVDVTFSKNKGKSRFNLSSNTTVNQKIIDFNFKDSNGFLGKGTIELLNDGVKITLDYTDKNKYDCEHKFTFEDKGDATEHDSGLREEILSFFNPDKYPMEYEVPFVCREELEKLGYKLARIDSEKIDNFYYATKNDYESEYLTIEGNGMNTESYAKDYEYLKNYRPNIGFTYEMDSEKGIIFEMETSGNYSQTHSVYSVFGRASLLTPDKVGEKPEDFVENDVVFSFVNAKEVLGKDDWVNVTYINKNHLKEYEYRMNAVEDINNTDFKNLESVKKLDGKNYKLNDFMLSEYPLEFYSYVKNYNSPTVQTMQLAIEGTDYYIAFYSDLDAEEKESEEKGFSDNERCIIYIELSEEYYNSGSIVPIRELDEYEKIPVTEEESLDEIEDSLDEEDVVISDVEDLLF